MEQDLCRGVVYFTVLCDHPYLVSLLFAVLVSLHPVTFSNVFYYLFTKHCPRLSGITANSARGSALQELLVFGMGFVLYSFCFIMVDNLSPPSTCTYVATLWSAITTVGGSAMQ